MKMLLHRLYMWSLKRQINSSQRRIHELDQEVDAMLVELMYAKAEYARMLVVNKSAPFWTRF